MTKRELIEALESLPCPDESEVFASVIDGGDVTDASVYDNYAEHGKVVWLS